MTHKKLKIAISGALAALSMGVSAQTIRPAYQYPGPAPQTGGAAIRMGESPFFFTPYVGLAAGYDDNLFLSSRNERSSSLYIVSPGFKIDARSPSSVFQLTHQSQFGQYTSSEDDNYQDHTTRAQLDMAFSGRAFWRVGYDYLRAHDPRGSTDRGFSARPDKYELRNPNTTFAFGAPGAQGRVELYYSDGHKKYLNNRETTFLSDRDTAEYGGAFYWRVMPKTYVLAEVRQTDISYEASISPFSGEERRYYAGVSWEATAATTGTLKVGRMEKKFDSLLPSYTGNSWEGIITWAPRTYSTFDFYTARQTTESTGLGNFIITETYGANWNHAWNSVVTTGVTLRYTRDEYQGFNRSDEKKLLGLRVGYRFRRWLTLGAEYSYTQRDSNLPQFEFDKNLYLLTATASM
jgi:hypothetical protein